MDGLFAACGEQMRGKAAPNYAEISLPRGLPCFHAFAPVEQRVAR